MISKTHSMNSTHPSPHKQHEACAPHACALWLPHTMPWRNKKTHTHRVKHMDKALLQARPQSLTDVETTVSYRICLHPEAKQAIKKENPLSSLQLFPFRPITSGTMALLMACTETSNQNHKQLPNCNLKMLQLRIGNTQASTTYSSRIHQLLDCDFYRAGKDFYCIRLHFPLAII